MTGFDTEETFPQLPDDAPDAAEEPRKKKKHALPFWAELPLLILAALVVAVLIKTFLIQAFWIPSSSMTDTLQVNDRVMVNKLAYQFGDVGRGDVVVFDDPRLTDPPEESIFEAVTRNVGEAIGVSVPRSEFIKRVVALPGETITTLDNRAYINGVLLNEPYINLSGGDRSGCTDAEELLVPAGHVFVMGDNRGSSQDSRCFGTVPVDTIVGKAFVIMWPADRWSGL